MEYWMNTLPRRGQRIGRCAKSEMRIRGWYPETVEMAEMWRIKQDVLCRVEKPQATRMLLWTKMRGIV
jgi:hypothetical protein